eukprot:m51a1_g8849 hypothetical protein (92) ;mRNA; f:480130-480405
MASSTGLTIAEEARAKAIRVVVESKAKRLREERGLGDPPAHQRDHRDQQDQQDPAQQQPDGQPPDPCPAVAAAPARSSLGCHRRARTDDYQ